MSETTSIGESISIVHLRGYKPLDVSFPSPGVYDRVFLVLPDLEPSILMRLSSHGGEPATAVLDFGRQVTAREILNFIKENLETFKEISLTFGSPVQRSVFARLHLSLNRERMGEISPPHNPLDDVPSYKNNG